ncbi:hypothetical protein [Streptomonospora salina]|uniref:DUF4352 domain-containing protein n=1 Tax=Streptomonospora salina TaxID=104205 RepID=A0A841EAL2_9ACTN|nr:hypothetical protein [Streptomonospora salina]MBB6000155.1 hypothetical protein [Streptomonospora salina]
MRTLPLVAAPLLAAVACSAGGGSTPQEEETLAEQEPSQQEQPSAAGPARVGLDETHDFGGGFTITMTELRREVDPDGFNSMTGEEGELPYVAWSFEITNNTGNLLHTGSTTSSCFVGDPLEETEQPVLGDAVNPPDQLADGQSATWDADCWMDEDESQLQYTLEFYDQESVSLYPPVTFAGKVPRE